MCVRMKMAYHTFLSVEHASLNTDDFCHTDREAFLSVSERVGMVKGLPKVAA